MTKPSKTKPTVSIVPAVKNTAFDFKAYPIVKGAANIEKLIKSTQKGYATLKPKLHQALLSATLHAVDTNDTTLVTRFWNSCGNEINKRNGIATWLNNATNLQYRKAKDSTMQWLKPKKENATTFDTTYQNVPFYDMPKVDKANSSAPFSFFASLERLMDKAENLRTAKKLDEYSDKLLQAISKAEKDFLKKHPLPVVSAVAGTPAAEEAQAA